MPKSVCSNFLINLVNFRSGFYELIFFSFDGFHGICPCFLFPNGQKKENEHFRFTTVYDLRYDEVQVFAWTYRQMGTCACVQMDIYGCVDLWWFARCPRSIGGRHAHIMYKLISTPVGPAAGSPIRRCAVAPQHLLCSYHRIRSLERCVLHYYNTYFPMRTFCTVVQPICSPGVWENRYFHIRTTRRPHGIIDYPVRLSYATRTEQKKPKKT